jgi:glucose/arabinose dehydrogenase
MLAATFTPNAVTDITLTEVGVGLSTPIGVTNAGDGSGRLFINERAGRIRVWQGGQVLTTPFLDITALVTSGGERGLLGLVFHPQYETNGFFYVNYINLAGDTVIARYSVSSDPNVANPASAQVILTVDQPEYANHKAGQMAFGPDGYLYIALGDGGEPGDASNRAQSLNTLLGKILRIDVNGTPPYSIPATNPFVGQAGKLGEIWAYGFRNPWRFSFDIANGDLFIGDVGEGAWEEIDYQPASSGGGENYGWRLKEGPACFNPPTNCDPGGLVEPVISYPHVTGGPRSITGGYRYRGSMYPLLNGVYFYGDFIGGPIWGAEQSGNTWTPTQLRTTTFPLPSFGEDDRGELFVVNFSGSLFRISSAVEYRRGDFDADTDIDLIWRHYGTGGNDVWVMNGQTYQSSVPVRGVAESQWRLEGTADFNKDGKTDLVWRNYNTGENVIWLMNGAVYQSTVVLRHVPESQWHIEGTGDFNRDGFADLVWRHSVTGANVVWLMNGTNYQSSVELRRVPEPQWKLEATGDFNGDGWTDLVWRHDSGSNVIWLMRGTSYVSSVEIRRVPEAQWRLEASGDFNGDGHTDLVWRHYGVGANVIWLMNRTNYVSTVSLPVVSDPGWDLEGVR